MFKRLQASEIVCPHCGSVRSGIPAEFVPLVHHYGIPGQQRLLLKLLLFKMPQSTTTNRMIEELWRPDDEPKNAHKIVHLLMHRLRKHIPNGWAIKAVRNEGYRLEVVELGN